MSPARQNCEATRCFGEVGAPKLVCEEHTFLPNTGNGGRRAFERLQESVKGMLGRLRFLLCAVLNKRFEPTESVRGFLFKLLLTQHTAGTIHEHWKLLPWVDHLHRVGARLIPESSPALGANPLEGLPCREVLGGQASGTRLRLEILN